MIPMTVLVSYLLERTVKRPGMTTSELEEVADLKAACRVRKKNLLPGGKIKELQ
jgi:hypothetical protein